MTTIPLVDLSLQHDPIADAVASGWEAVIASGAFTGGPAVAAFEDAYAEFLGVAHCVGVSNGTDALELALRARGIGPGDEVIVPANTFIATVEAVVRAGATPVACDVHDSTLQIDVDDARARITDRTAAIIPVHLHGHPAPMAGVRTLATARNLFVLEDAAQSQGARIGGEMTGTLGDAAGTSFYPGKNLGAYGDAGAVMTNDTELAARVRRLREHGSAVKYQHDEFGCTARLDALQAVVLRAKLAHLPTWNDQRSAAARMYTDLLEAVPGVRTPMVAADVDPVWHCYVVRVPERDRVLAQMQARGIGVGIHYPVPVHQTPAWRNAGLPVADLPVAQQAAREMLSLPIYPGITRAQQHEVVNALMTALRQAA